VRYVVHHREPFSVVGDPSFRDLIIHLEPEVEEYLIKHGDSMKKWVMDEYKIGVSAIKTAIKSAKSKIHLSFDVWTAPNGTPILGVAAHFLTSELTLKHPLLALEVFTESHTAEKMAEVLRKVMLEWELDAS
jgi:hypothetical protein